MEEKIRSKSTLANRVSTAANMIAYDNACKRVIANKIILAWILKSCAKEYGDYSIEDIARKYIEGTPEVSKTAVNPDEEPEYIEGMDSEDTTINEGVVRYDIKFKAVIPDTNETADMIVNVEAQNDFYPGYPIIKRGIYYGSRMISSQYGTVFTKSHYEKIKKVYSIWICPNPPVYRKNTIAKYSIIEDNVIGITDEKTENYDLINVITVCLGGHNKEHYEGLLKVLDVLLTRERTLDDKRHILQEEFGIVMNENIESEVWDMCNLSIGVYEEGYNDAYNDAYNESKIMDIRNLMDSTDWNIDKCMNILKIPHDKRELYKETILSELATV